MFVVLNNKTAAIHEDSILSVFRTRQEARMHEHFVLIDSRTREGAMHDGVRLTMCCLSRCNEITNQIIVWTEESLRLSCSKPERLRSSMTCVDEQLLARRRQDHQVECNAQ